MPLLLNTYHEDKNSLKAIVRVNCIDPNGESIPIFGKNDEIFIQNICDKQIYIQDIKSGKINPQQTINELKIKKQRMAATQFVIREYLMQQTLTVDYIIDITAPYYINGKHGEDELLRSCYINALNVAKSYGCKSIIIPLISSKLYKYPPKEAVPIAITAIKLWLATNDINVSLHIFDRKLYALANSQIEDVGDFINNHYKFKCSREYKGFFGRLKAFFDRAEFEKEDHYSPRKLDILERAGAIYLETTIHHSDPLSKGDQEEKKRQDEESERRNEKLINAVTENFLTEKSFSAILMKYIKSKNADAVDVYKRANIDRKLFSKIRSDRGYMPSKRTAVALAVSLKLSLEETNNLLGGAGFTLSRSLLFDVIIEYFITKGNYDIYEINDILFSYNQPTLGE